MGGGGQDPSPTNDRKLPRGSSPLPHFPRDLRLRMGLRPDQRRLPSPSRGRLHPTPFLPQPRELTRSLQLGPGAQTGGSVGPGEASGPGGVEAGGGFGWQGACLRTVQVAVAVLTVSLTVGVDVERCPAQNPEPVKCGGHGCGEAGPLGAGCCSRILQKVGSGTSQTPLRGPALEPGAEVWGPLGLRSHSATGQPSGTSGHSSHSSHGPLSSCLRPQGQEEGVGQCVSGPWGIRQSPCWKCLLGTRRDSQAPQGRSLSTT